MRLIDADAAIKDANLNYGGVYDVALVKYFLKSQPTFKLDRSRWKGCEHCKGDLEGYTVCFRDANGRSRSIYILDGEEAIVVPVKYNHKFYIPIKYCPFCGRSLTKGS